MCLPRNLQNNLLYNINSFSKVAGHEIHLQRSVAFLDTSNEQIEKEYRKTFPFIISWYVAIFGEFFGSFRYKIMSSVTRDNMNSSLPIWIPFIYSSRLIALVRNSKTMLSRSGESEYPCLFPNFMGSGFSFSP
jgi:hypothetical protein